MPPRHMTDLLRAGENISAVFRINGQDCPVPITADVFLLDLLRAHLRLTGTRKGETTAGGACTVLIRDARVLCCLTLAVSHSNERSQPSKGSKR